MVDSEVLAQLLSKTMRLAEFRAELEHAGISLPRVSKMPVHPTEQGLTQLLLSMIEFFHQFLEHQILEQMAAGTISDMDIEQTGYLFMQLEARIAELKHLFDLEPEVFYQYSDPQEC